MCEMSKHAPLLSICCQTYNHVNFIEECLQGFLMQKTNFSFEILLRDDASTDGTNDICKKYAEFYPDKINLLTYTQNQYQKGVKPFFDNVKRAKGKYIAICEGDDYWTDPLKLQKQVDFLEANSDFGLIYSDYKSLTGYELTSNSSLNMNYPTLSSYFQDDLRFIYTGSWVMRNCLDDYTPLKSEVVLPGDVQVICYILNLGYKVKYLNEVMGVYRLLPESASHSDLSDKNLSFVLVKYFLVEKYKSGIHEDVYNYIWERLIERNFHYFQYFSLTIFNRFRLFSEIRLRKGIVRTLKFVVLNNSK